MTEREISELKRFVHGQEKDVEYIGKTIEGIKGMIEALSKKFDDHSLATIEREAATRKDLLASIDSRVKEVEERMNAKFSQLYNWFFGVSASIFSMLIVFFVTQFMIRVINKG